MIDDWTDPEGVEESEPIPWQTVGIDKVQGRL
jgi:hypothetical protein